jgi:aerobic-type carbon monoxide dehydrogenase small subunit (CoxS/CutS family)
MTFTLTVNGQRHVVDVAVDTPLLTILRYDLQLNGSKFGCGLSQCGACTVHLAGQAIRSCVTPVSASLHRRAGGAARLLHEWRDHVRGLQLKQNPQPSEHDIKQALQGNLCRCGSRVRVLRASARRSHKHDGDEARFCPIRARS